MKIPFFSSSGRNRETLGCISRGWETKYAEAVEKCPLVVDAKTGFQAGRRNGEAKVDLHNYARRDLR